ncbi:MAG: ABC transporter permease [Chloroflexota bacterium]|nr:ABC transporter permease [Chloroflexota bacterium]
MSIRRLWAILRKEFRHIWRDKRTLFLVTLSPAIMLVTFSYLFGMEVTRVRLGVWDQDQSALSRRFVAGLTADGKFVVTATPGDYESLRQAMMRGDISLGVVIPPGFEQKIIADESSPLQAIADGSDAISLSRILVRLRERTTELNLQIAPRDAVTGAPIVLQTQAWYNRDLDSMIAMVPGLIPVVLILHSLAIALAITREKELGSFETLVATPIRSLEYIVGKLIPYIAYGSASAIIAILLAMIWFGVPLRGSPITLMAFTIVYLFASLCESLFISSFLSSQGTAMRIILLLFFVPSFFLTGVILPVDTRSAVSQIVSALLPATHFVTVTRGIFLKASGVSQLLHPMLALCVLGMVPFALSLLLFRKQVD